jgi:feruloyl esterase
MRFNPKLLTVTILFAIGLTNVSRAAGITLPAIKPIKSCADLVHTDLGSVAETPGKVTAAEQMATDKGSFCKISAQFEPLILLTIYLPSEHWTQRYIQNGNGGGAPGPNGYGYAGGCMPALNGEFAVGANNLGHFEPGAPNAFTTAQGWEWAKDPQKRIDYAYRSTHTNVLAARALMKAYYGHAPRYSYFMVCSEGGRDALVEAQRFPEDFDGVVAGAPAALQTAQETTFHLWIARANTRADGTNILMPDKRKLAHDAVLAQCDTLSGVKDGLLQDPGACHFNPASMQCPAGTTNAASCFTAEEVTALQKMYDGAYDAEGNHLHFGLQHGGEALWNLPNTPTADAPGARQAALSMAYLLLPEVTPAAADYSHMQFSKADFAHGSTLTPLYDGANTNLKPFAARGGRLILWHGLSDFQIPPGATLAYYRGVQNFVGERAADQFVRLFMLPGVGHCSGGDGYDQIDALSAVMAWRELKQAPTQIMSGKPAARPAQGANAGGGEARPIRPIATPTPALAATRPVYQYPGVARYTGKGDPADGVNYLRAASPEPPVQVFTNEASRLFAPNNQKFYAVKDGKLVELQSQH